MIPDAIHLISFSPCGHTLDYGRQMVDAIRARLPKLLYIEQDITPFASQTKKLSFGPTDFAILCAPVFGGRLPGPAADRFAAITASGTPALLLVTYGNRAFDDALSELQMIAVASGFRPAGAAACIAQHTLVKDCAAGRPNRPDIESARNFAISVIDWLAANGAPQQRNLSATGSADLKPYQPVPLPQTVNDKCIMCGLCWTLCPTAAITHDAPAQVDSSACIACMGCVNICPTGARIPDQNFMATIQAKITPLCSGYKENEFFDPKKY